MARIAPFCYSPGDSRAQDDSHRQRVSSRRTGETAISKKVFVGNLSFDVTREELIEAFSAAGKVLDAKVPTDRETGRPRGFAFVEFESEESVPKSITHLNGVSLKGRPLRVSEAEDRPPRAPGSGPAPRPGPRPGGFSGPRPGGFGGPRPGGFGGPRPGGFGGDSTPPFEEARETRRRTFGGGKPSKPGGGRPFKEKGPRRVEKKRGGQNKEFEDDLDDL